MDMSVLIHSALYLVLGWGELENNTTLLSTSLSQTRMGPQPNNDHPAAGKSPSSLFSATLLTCLEHTFQNIMPTLAVWPEQIFRSFYVKSLIKSSELLLSSSGVCL